jgi:hypothetical protein
VAQKLPQGFKNALLRKKGKRKKKKKKKKRNPAKAEKEGDENANLNLLLGEIVGDGTRDGKGREED